MTELACAGSIHPLTTNSPVDDDTGGREAVLGQLFLVTAVAKIIPAGQPRRWRRSEEPDEVEATEPADNQGGQR